MKSAQDEEHSHGPVILRKKRAAGKEKNTCQLFIQTDHLFLKYYGTREAVIAQVYNHTYMQTSLEAVVSAPPVDISFLFSREGDWKKFSVFYVVK